MRKSTTQDMAYRQCLKDFDNLSGDRRHGPEMSQKASCVFFLARQKIPSPSYAPLRLVQLLNVIDRTPSCDSIVQPYDVFYAKLDGIEQLVEALPKSTHPIKIAILQMIPRVKRERGKRRLAVQVRSPMHGHRL